MTFVVHSYAHYVLWSILRDELVSLNSLGMSEKVRKSEIYLFCLCFLFCFCFVFCF